MQQPAVREITLIPNTVIRSMDISPQELRDVGYKSWPCELGQPTPPDLNDWREQRMMNDEVRERLRRFETVSISDVVGCVYNTRVDVAGNLVGSVTVNYDHPKAKAFEKALMKPKCGVTVYPRFKLKHLYMAKYTVAIIGFDVGFK